MSKIQQLAAETLEHLVRNPRGGYMFTDDAPTWFRDAVYDAHERGEILPDDYIYSHIVEALGLLAGGVDPDELYDEMHHIADVYYADLLAWVGSHPRRWTRVDEAMQDGASDLAGAIQSAQVAERAEVAAIVADVLRDRIDDSAE